MPYLAWMCVPLTISGIVDIPKIFEWHFLQQMTSQWGSKKLLQL